MQPPPPVTLDTVPPLSLTAPDCAGLSTCAQECAVCLCTLRLSYSAAAAAALSPAAILPPCGMHPGVDGLQSCSHPRSCTPNDSGCMDAPVEGKYTFHNAQRGLMLPCAQLEKTRCALTRSSIRLQSSHCVFGGRFFFLSIKLCSSFHNP